ncbi:MAG TPA: amidohydrolase family protein [Planctomycetota bacterium]|nr:amidohydrolase family protein [Planctomycetota bacterium]
MRQQALLALLATFPLVALAQDAAPASAPRVLFHDAHFHRTNYVQEGPSVARVLELMGDRVGRVALTGIPLQQTWAHGNSGDDAPTYYLESDAPLYYYSFVDAVTATEYLKLDAPDRARFDPMIIGFNPADMYAVDHVKRVLATYPGVFSGIGEFTIHKEFVSSKVAGEIASLRNPALGRLLDFCAESGLVALIHCDIDTPFAKNDELPAYALQMRDLLLAHPGATVVWAHLGLGRVVHPYQPAAGARPGERPPGHLDLVARILERQELPNLHFDISWSEVAKYVVATPESTRATAELVNRFPTRFLFGTDSLAPQDEASYLSVYESYQPLWALLTPEARAAVTTGNYERLFDAARTRVRAWEAAHLGR